MSDGIDFNWLRRIRVAFEGLSGAGNSVYESDGTQEKARIIATISKTIQSLPMATTMMMYNLSPDTRRALQGKGIKIGIEAGWDHGPFSGLKRCFYGELCTAYSIRSGSDIVTTITALSMAEDMARAWHNDVWGPGTTAATIVRQLAGKLKSVTLDDSRIKGLDNRKLSMGGWTHSGSVRSALEMLSKEFGFSWAVVDGVFQAVKDLQSLGGNDVIEDPYLVSVNPILQGNGILQTVIGLRIRCTFKATINPAFNIEVKSQVSPEFNGKYYALSITHNLDCFNANSFITDIDVRNPEAT